MACPHVSSVAALVWAKNPTLTNTEVRAILQSMATELGAAGKDKYYGYELVNAQVATAATPNDPLTVSDPTQIGGAVDVPISTSSLSFTLSDPEGLTMDYTVTTTPDAGSGSGYSVSSGTYSVPVSLAYSTIYTWTVTVDDKINIPFSRDINVHDRI